MFSLSKKNFSSLRISSQFSSPAFLLDWIAKYLAIKSVICSLTDYGVLFLSKKNWAVIGIACSLSDFFVRFKGFGLYSFMSNPGLIYFFDPENVRILIRGPCDFRG